LRETLFIRIHYPVQVFAVYHDENLNGVMDANEKGFPKEGYGFSTKNKMLGRAKFEQAAFEVSGDQAVEVKMIYPAGSTVNSNKN
ncbi:MAG TPA: DUF2141 domain-containing protein, partial [Bacteroidales bacterium]|nr:DUF2141 domain-containing protein [Bacteroidales bacterium]